MTEIFWRDFIFSDKTADIERAVGASHQSLIAEGLEADYFEFTAFFNSEWLNGYYVPNPPAYADYLTVQGEAYCVTNGTNLAGQNAEAFENWQYAEPISLYNDGEFIAEYYVTNIAPILTYPDGTTKYAFECLSFVGLMVEMTHAGGVYENAKVGDVLAEILNATQDVSKSTTDSKWFETEYGIHYTVDTQVYNQRVDGHLPYADGKRTARDNVRDVLFQCGASILKNADGSLRFTYSQPEIPTIVDDTEIYIGDKYGTSQRVTQVNVIEHQFYKLTNDFTALYDTGASVVDNVLVKFQEPVFALDYPATMTVSEWGSNYAIVSGAGVLSGKLYTHTEKVHSRSLSAGTPKEKTADIRLISSLNYEDILNRVENYYKNAREINAKIIITPRVKTGSLISLNDPLGRKKGGYIKDTNFILSGIVAGDTVIVVNWTPTAVGTSFTETDVLTGSGVWSKADAEARTGKQITKIRVILIGGGSGGWHGAQGSGYNTNPENNAHYAGGDGGQGGDGGKIIQIDIDTVANTYNFVCGVGGQSETEGTDTTFGTYSTATGTRSASGIMNIINGNIAGYNGEEGIRGGDGGEPREKGGDVTDRDGHVWVGGRSMRFYEKKSTGEIRFDGYAGGGGSAVGHNGNNPDERIDTFIGGLGASAEAPTKVQVAGVGGYGGNGGGGSGNAEGTGRNMYLNGGNGSAGGQGGDGVVWVIY